MNPPAYDGRSIRRDWARKRRAFWWEALCWAGVILAMAGSALVFWGSQFGFILWLVFWILSFGNSCRGGLTGHLRWEEMDEEDKRHKARRDEQEALQRKRWSDAWWKEQNEASARFESQQVERQQTEAVNEQMERSKS
jgi:hypothetical protein